MKTIKEGIISDEFEGRPTSFGKIETETYCKKVWNVFRTGGFLAPKGKGTKKAFTLLELLIVMGIVSGLAVLVALVANPVEQLKQSRDARRVLDVQALAMALSAAQNENASMGDSNVVYVSIPDVSPICANSGLGSPPAGWTYVCASPTNYLKGDGTGWIPVNVAAVGGSQMTVLPIDPENRAVNRAYYTYIAKGGFTAKLESQKVITEQGAKDSGIDNALYEVGANPNPIALVIAPTVTTNAASPIAQTTATLKGSGNPNGSATNGWFRYDTANPGGCNDTFGTATTPQGIGGGVSSMPYSTGITGLSPLTTYYFCGIAQNVGGLAFGSMQNFATLGNLWAKLTPTGTAPPIRYAHSAVWDATRDKMYVFGGSKGASGSLNDLWSYSATTNAWVQLTPTGTAPDIRYSHSAVWDAGRNKMYVFGGFKETIVTSLNDLWSYDASANSWTKLTPTGTPPDGRYAHTAVWDAARNKMYVFGGYSNNTGLYYSDLWSYDASANSWTKLTPGGVSRPIIAFHSAVWDSLRSKMYTFGGYNGASYFNDIFTYDAVANTWTGITPSGTAPGKRYEHSAVYDGSSDKMFVFGGYNAGVYNNEIWSYNGATNAWLKVTPSGTAPTGRDMHTTVWDTARNKMYVFGGYNAGNWYNDIWAFTR
jgi:prepilin-type N-terminal cleavage/methylation domain-containing protein